MGIGSTGMEESKSALPRVGTRSQRESGTLNINLYYYRARYYDAELGRFIAEDPTGMMGGVNVYTYAANNPGNLVDPQGTHPLALIILLAIAFVLNNPTIVNEEEGPTATTVLPNAVVMATILGPSALARCLGQAETLQGEPKPSPKFETPTNPPQYPPKEIPPGWQVREMPPTKQYPNGYWKLEKPMKDGSWQPINPCAS